LYVAPKLDQHDAFLSSCCPGPCGTGFWMAPVADIVSGSDPSFMLITQMWYTRREQPLRIGLWYTANGAGIALGGLLGYAIGHIKGALASWRYEFIIIGALCCTWGIVLSIFLPDSPVKAKFLNDREKRIAVERLKANQTGVENKHLKMYQGWCYKDLLDCEQNLICPQSRKPLRISSCTCSSPLAWSATFPMVVSRTLEL
jgi:MFS family permease